jgi:hypothetical protein
MKPWLLVVAVAGITAGCGDDRSSMQPQRAAARSDSQQHGDSRATDGLIDATDATSGLFAPNGFSADLGEFWEATQVTHRFSLKNVSGELVRFRNAVTTTCGCTSGRLSRTELQPGEVTEIELVIQVPPTAGEDRKYAAILHREMSDGLLRDIAFTVSARTRPVWTVVPSFLLVRPSSDSSEPVQAHVNVFGSLGRESQILDVTCSISGATVSFERGPLDHAQPSSVTLSIPAGTRDGEYRLTVTTNDELVPQRSLPVTIQCQSRLIVAPGTLAMRRRLPDGGFSGQLTVLVRDSEAQIECTGSDSLKCVVRPAVTSSGAIAKHQVEVTFSGHPESLGSDVELSVTAKTATGPIAVTRVPVRFVQ